MTSFPKDSAGVEFNPAIHQANRDGSPKLTNAGRYFLKGRRGPALKVSPQGPTVRAKPAAAPRAKPAAPSPSPVKSAEPVTAPTASADELPAALREIPRANVSDILGRDLPPVTVAPEGEGAPEVEIETEEAPPAAAPAEGSYVAPDAPAAAAEGAGLQSEGFAALAVSVFETSARVGIDPDEWELKPEERADLTGSVCKVLDKYGIGGEVSPETELAVALIAVGVRRAPLPKTRSKLKEWFGGMWAKFMGAESGPNAGKAPAKAQ